MKSKLFLFLFLLTTIGTPAVIHAQDTVWRVFDTGRLDSLNSTVLKEKRMIQVFVPPAYKPGSKDKYDVLYVLDGGNWNTGLILKTRRFLEDERYIPPMIIVSIMGIDRNKDLTPTRIEGWNTSGGAANFRTFIKDELIPYINKTYPSNGDNTLWGHSLGGLFVIDALLNAPQTFKSYIAVDPSLWWDNCYIQKIAPAKLPALAGSNTTLFISGREGPEGAVMKIDSMNLILRQMAPAGLLWKSIAYPDETHSSVRLKSIYDGLKFSYGWQNGNIDFHPRGGIIRKNDTIPLWYFGDTANVRYTLDGAEPTRASEHIQSEMYLTDAAIVTIKQFTRRARYDKMKSGTFMMGKTLQPVSKPAGVQPGGFHYAYYEVDSSQFQQLKGLTPQQTGITDSAFQPGKLPRKNNYALLIDGWLETQEEGYYIFLLDADTDSKLYLNDQLLIRWNGSSADRTSSYILPLTKGFYRFRLEYLHKNEDFGLRMSYVLPSAIQAKNPQPVPVDLQYSRR